MKEDCLTQPNLNNITAADLRDDERLSLLYFEAVRRKFWPNNVTAVLEFWCLAEKALYEVKRGSPGKLFYFLVKAKNMRFITDAIEQQAMRRMTSSDRHTLVDRAGRLIGLATPYSEETHYTLFGDKPDVGYNHSVMMQCFLPQKRLPDDQRDYQVSHGRASLLIEAGRLANPEKMHEFIQCGLPFGSRARLIIPYINAYAVIRKTREIDLGKNLWCFMEKIGSPINVYNGKMVVEQIQALAAAQFILGEWSEAGATTQFGRFAEEVSFWIERDKNQHLLWSQSMLLSKRYYDALQGRHVPIDMNHLVKLTRSERRMDLYSWFSYRLPTIQKGKVVHIPLRDIRPIFAPDNNSPKLFKQRLAQDLKAVAKIYPDFRVEVVGDMLVLQKSPPPVPRKVALLL